MRPHPHLGPTSRHAPLQRDPHAFFGGPRAAMHAWHALRHAMGRHRGGEGPGDFGDRFGEGFGRGFGGFGDGDGFGRGRKFTSEDLQLMLLVLLAERPSHGYELIKALDARSNGFYSPSPRHGLPGPHVSRRTRLRERDARRKP